MIRVLLILMAQASWAAEPFVVKDLRSQWLQFITDDYQPLTKIPDKDLHTIYFQVKSPLYKGQYLSIKGTEDCDLFVNGKLIYSGQQQVFNIDSLYNLYSSDLFVAVHAISGLSELNTQIVFQASSAFAISKEMVTRPMTFFRDYTIIVTSVLLIFFLILFRTNPQLTFDYFSFAKIFSVQERNENLLASRITSSVNFLFYLFCAMLTGFLLSIVFYFDDSFFLIAKFMDVHSLSGAFMMWVKLSLLILVLLASKLFIVLLFSSLFNFTETVSFQFFNFLRFVLFTAVVMAISSLVYFVLKGGQPVFYERLMVLALVLLSAGSVMVLIKLLVRAPFSFFHLFSYLCASEIIPLVIIIKVFF